MKNKIISFAFSTILFVAGSSAVAQQPKKVPRIGFLAAGVAPIAATRLEAFRQGLRALGYVEGKTSLLNIAMLRANSIKSHGMQPNWFASK
jgi:putative tryptophan/tyrosine transport system substrate-binding protein